MIIKADDVRRAIIKEANDPSKAERFPYGRGDLAMSVRALALMGFDVEVGVDLVQVDDDGQSYLKNRK